MIQISGAQWSRMGEESFAARVVAIIRRHHPDQAARTDFPALDDAIRRQAAKARHYGLDDEHSAATYVYTPWLLGEAFDTRIPAVAQILADASLAPPDKARALGDFSSLVFHTLAGDDGQEPQRSAA